MSIRICQTCGKEYNSNDPGRMTVCFQCCPPGVRDIEQEEPDTITPPTGFTRDFRKTNPTLHLLYVKWAVKHLGMVRKMTRKLLNESNFNARGFAEALMAERDRLVLDNAAYADAQEILESIGLK